MKLRNAILIIIALFTASLPLFAQKVTVTGRKQVYTRPKPQSEYKKTFAIRRPAVTAATPALSRTITSLLDPAKVLDIDIKEELSEIQWLEQADFKVVYNDNGILSVMVWMEGTAAYPDGVTKYVVVDTAKGTRISPADVFAETDALAALVKKRQDTAVAEAIKVMKADPDFGDQDPRELFENTDFQSKDLEGFSVDADGVTFVYDYGFPHVIVALEPDGEFKVSWAELKPYIRKDGLLARFVA